MCSWKRQGKQFEMTVSRSNDINLGKVQWSFETYALKVINAKLNFGSQSEGQPPQLGCVVLLWGDTKYFSLLKTLIRYWYSFVLENRNNSFVVITVEFLGAVGDQKHKWTSTMQLLENLLSVWITWQESFPPSKYPAQIMLSVIWKGYELKQVSSLSSGASRHCNFEGYLAGNAQKQCM